VGLPVISMAPLLSMWKRKIIGPLRVGVTGLTNPAASEIGWLGALDRGVGFFSRNCGGGQHDLFQSAQSLAASGLPPPSKGPDAERGGEKDGQQNRNYCLSQHRGHGLPPTGAPPFLRCSRQACSTVAPAVAP
jgi:hypothetical protein